MNRSRLHQGKRWHADCFIRTVGGNSRSYRLHWHQRRLDYATLLWVRSIQRDLDSPSRHLESTSRCRGDCSCLDRRPRGPHHCGCRLRVTRPLARCCRSRLLLLLKKFIEVLFYSLCNLCSSIDELVEEPMFDFFVIRLRDEAELEQLHRLFHLVERERPARWRRCRCL